MSLLVVIPTYNERENIPKVLEGIFSQPVDAHVLVVDDNSPDGTGPLVESLKATYGDRLALLTRGKKSGLGKAYLHGFSYALERNYSKIVQMDADLSHDPGALPGLLEASNRFDLVLGSRYVPGGETRGWPFRRRFLSSGANFYARTLLRMDVRDLTTGYRCWNRRVLEKIGLETIETSGYGFQVEMAFRANEAGFSIGEFPIVFCDRTLGISKMGFPIAWEGAVNVFKLRWRRAGRRETRLKTPVASPETKL